MSQFYFFTDFDLLTPQPDSDAFGITGPDSQGRDTYRIASLHSAFPPTPAYAVCDGVVCAQDIPNTSPALVNVILRPLDRPPLNFVPVRYYIYKGILKSSLIDGLRIAARQKNHLTESLWKAQDAKNLKADTNLDAPAEALGIHLSKLLDSTLYGDDASIDNLFRSSGDHQFEVVRGGWTIGEFNDALFGFQVLLEGLSIHHPLIRARSLDDRISVFPLTDPPGTPEAFAHWHKKEAILGYMDPCAFYGSFYSNRILAKRSTASFEVKSATDDSLYHDVVSQFANRNKAYLDIRNHHNHSLNYYGNYDSTFEVAYDSSSSLIAAEYYAGDWPIFTTQSSDFPSTNSGKFNTVNRPGFDRDSGDWD